VGQVGLIVGERKAEVLLARALAVADRRREARRAAARIERGAAGIVERQRKREADPLLYLRDALQHLFARHVVHPPALVVGAELAPVRTRRFLFPPLRHKKNLRIRDRPRFVSTPSKKKRGL